MSGYKFVEKYMNTLGMGFAPVVLLALVLAGCGKDPDIASVGGRDITQSEFDAYLKFKRIPPPKDKKGPNPVLDQYLEREALASAIEKEGNYDKKMTEVELNEFRKQMLISRYFEKYLRDKVSDDAVHNYYSTHAKDYEERKVHVAHILFRTNRNMKEAERKAKLTTAQEAYSKIKAGKKFEKIAESYSEDKISGKKGGDLGWIKEGAIDPRFSEKIFSMEAGKVSEPFETAFGYHIVKVLEAPVVVKRPFEAAQGDIRYQLRNEAKQAEVKRLLSEVKIKKN